MADVSQLTVNISGVSTTVNIKDAEARRLIEALGDAMTWLGVTTTALTDGATTNPVTINSESVTAVKGNVVQYDGEEFAWNGSAWQSLGKNNFGALAFKSSASGSYTPTGNITVTHGSDTTATVNSITAVGTLPSFSLSGETLVFNAGTLPTKGSDQTVVTASGVDTASFSGNAATITVS